MLKSLGILPTPSYNNIFETLFDSCSSFVEIHQVQKVTIDFLEMIMKRLVRNLLRRSAHLSFIQWF